MAIDLDFRRRAVRTLTNQIGCYALCDLDDVPIYVGQSRDGIRSRVNRHLTSARSDIIANRQIDVWEIAFVRAFPVESPTQIDTIENALFHRYHPVSALMNGKVPPLPVADVEPVEPAQIVQVMSAEEIAAKRDPALRLPRQAEHYSQIVGHFLAVKNSREIAGAIAAHFQRLERYHRELLRLGQAIEGDGLED
ncbi:excinuclease ABC subunit C [Sphingomonas sp. Leaf24]|uniref:GIY-YIG nuclease family protein n=1 Tax=unclassified Sphingomonas TaxID=196159 RepID=UPI0006FA5744|nr:MULTISPECIES: GIY-YIG nuclease family protein [unclassified Sphingomonas]KQM13239.1 excinuclease ABC subunit C [Sphingomonas sp. Leaf5]KQM85825.1 excinuclease ABC subunit C [Sphingomonas sp. Leaf24]